MNKQTIAYIKKIKLDTKHGDILVFDERFISTAAAQNIIFSLRETYPEIIGILVPELDAIGVIKVKKMK